MSLARKLLAGLLIFVVIVLVASAGLWLTRPAPLAYASLSSSLANGPLAPEIGDPRQISAAMRIEGDPRLLIDQNARFDGPIASMAKVVTALVVLDAAPLELDESGPSWIVTRADAELLSTLVVNGAASLPITVGLELNQRQLLEAMLVASSAVHAYLLAEKVFGSVEAYRDAAAEWLARQQLGSTRIVDPVGGSVATRSTPAELLTIAERALENPVIAEIVALPATDVPLAGRVPTTNPLLGSRGIDGVKTGTLIDVVGYCMLFSIAPDSERGVPRIFGVMLGAGSLEERVTLVEDMVTAAQAGFSSFSRDEGVAVAQYMPAWGESVDVVLDEAVAGVTWSALPPQLDLRPLDEGRRGDVVGTAEYWTSTGSRTVVVRLADDLPAAPWWWRILHGA